MLIKAYYKIKCSSVVMFNSFFKNYLYSLFFINILFFTKINKSNVSILNLKQRNIFFFELSTYSNSLKSTLLDLVLDSDLTDKPCLFSNYSNFSLTLNNALKNVKNMAALNIKFLHKFTIFYLKKKSYSLTLNKTCDFILNIVYFKETLLKLLHSLAIYKIFIFKKILIKSLKKNYYKIKKKIFRKKPKTFFKSNYKKHIKSHNLFYVKNSFFKDINFTSSNFYASDASDANDILESAPSLNFKYKYNYLYKQIRIFHFFKKIRNNKTVKYFSKLNKLTLINFIYNFFNIKLITNFFFITSAQHKFLINKGLIYVNGTACIAKNLKLKKFDIIQLPISLNILNFLISAEVFNFILLNKLILNMNPEFLFTVALWKRKEILFYQLLAQSWVELDYLTLSCVILDIPKNYNFFKSNATNLFFFKSYNWRT